ncbi:tRNA lysidine(34) synthetase TilS [Rhizobium sp. CG5]|uniref:tRNA lysidine(34) synthetase TilS n=1 Tax=Rhizobium sp. CG5 TaxID=2726076 RepID=UPI002033259C|nr:tRNA lysidine(34) synthetase TilS [Rhizobium sp. CG5]MCM2473367.1 tRNA lysidine(34) synthetase TilS [Rhizobium sp. CG5]
MRQPARLLVAISGGSDSTGLLIALHQVLRTNAFPHITLAAATIDHALRDTSAAEAADVAKLCASLGISHTIRRWHGQKPATGISAAAREARYRLLAEAAAELGATLILTAHTLEDQAETIAMRAARSDTQASGLAGMADAVLYDRRIWIARPLLFCRRADIRRLLTDHGLGWIDDPSNTDARYERVRTRQALAATGLPELDPQSTTRRTALSARAADRLRNHAKTIAGAAVQIAPAGLSEPGEDLRHMLSAAIATVGGRVHGPGRDSMDRVLALLRQPPGGQLTTGRTVLSNRRDGLFILRENRGILPLVIAAGDVDLWDDRFEIANLCDVPLTVEGDADGAIPDLALNLPSGLARLARKGLPSLSRSDDGQPVGSQDARITLRIAPFDLFLPRFDLTLADALAAVFGRDPYLPPPF